MEVQAPESKGFTVYSKSGCPQCWTVKQHIKEKHFLLTEINCDEYLLEDKEAFLESIQEYTKVAQKTFPMVFYDGKYLGGWGATVDFMDKMLLSFEDNF
ncbi:MAG: glutaredoxin [Flavobacterium sp.]|jgi:glutaredoxin